jgi:hypothetical protein
MEEGVSTNSLWEYNKEFFEKGFSLQPSEYARKRGTGKPGSEKFWGQLLQDIKVLGMWRAST